MPEARAVALRASGLGAASLIPRPLRAFEVFEPEFVGKMAAQALRAAGGAVAFAGGMVLTYEISRPKIPLPSEKERCCTFDRCAPSYDAEIDRDEKTSGIIDLRRELVSRARGSVLEVAGGTGRNLPFYRRDGVRELVCTDASKEMLEVAARKVAHARAHGGDGAPSSVTLAVVDAARQPFEDARFDTVVDSFGLCSFEDPAAALAEMRRCCKPGGRVLLLEHGVSSFYPLALWQRHRLGRHVQKWGCYWDRDILGLVAASGLKIVEQQRRHLGTTYVLQCEPG